MNKVLTKIASIISIILSGLIVLSVLGLGCFYILPEMWAWPLFDIFRGDYFLFGIMLGIIGFVLFILAFALILVGALVAGIGLIISIIVLVVCNKEPSTYAKHKSGILAAIIVYGVWTTLLLIGYIVVMCSTTIDPQLWWLLPIPIIFEACFAMLLIDFIRNKKILPKFLEKKSVSDKKEAEAYASSPWAPKDADGNPLPVVEKKKEETKPNNPWVKAQADTDAETVVIEDKAKKETVDEVIEVTDPDLNKKKKSKKK